MPYRCRWNYLADDIPKSSPSLAHNEAVFRRLGFEGEIIETAEPSSLTRALINEDLFFSIKGLFNEFRKISFSENKFSGAEIR
jgi:hypothetical protein